MDNRGTCRIAWTDRPSYRAPHEIKRIESITTIEQTNDARRLFDEPIRALPLDHDDLVVVVRIKAGNLEIEGDCFEYQ